MDSSRKKTCTRVPLTDSTKRRLWAGSGGYCANPSCGNYLFDEESAADFAEMAHIISASAGGPRDVDTLSATERALPENVVVLCANCHTVVDKAPGNYPMSTLKSWKNRHQEELHRIFGTPQFVSRSEGRVYLESMFDDNHAAFESYGPIDGNFSETRANQWRRHAIQTIVPNNAKIRRALSSNLGLLGPEERATVATFNIHAREFEDRHLLNDWSAGSARFPIELLDIFRGEPR